MHQIFFKRLLAPKLAYELASIYCLTSSSLFLYSAPTSTVTDPAGPTAPLAYAACEKLIVAATEPLDSQTQDNLGYSGPPLKRIPTRQNPIIKA